MIAGRKFFLQRKKGYGIILRKYVKGRRGQTKEVCPTRALLYSREGVQDMDVCIDDELIEQIAILAKLELSPGEKARAKSDMGRMLEYVDCLKKVDTSGVEPLCHLFSQCNVFREDEVVDTDDPAGLLANAPKLRDGAFVVPSTISPAEGE